MTAKVFSEFCKGGRLLLPYIFIREIGMDSTIMLSELLAEFNYASKYGFDDNVGFIFDIYRASKVLNADYNGIVSQLNYLQEIGFISIDEIGIEGSYYIQINEDNIISCKTNEERKNFCNSWDDGLLASLNPTHKEVNFSESTLKVKQYFDSKAKSPKSIPMLDYLLLDKLIKDYEQLFGDIFYYINGIEEFLENCTYENDSREGLSKFYNALDATFIKMKKKQESLRDEIPPDNL